MLGKTFPAVSATAAVLKGQYGEWGHRSADRVLIVKEQGP